jgi:hypothetical protein
MERTKRLGVNTNRKVDQMIHTMASQLVLRHQLSAKFGTDQYDGARNIYQALGYPEIIKYEDYIGRYQRQDIAKAIIDRPVRATWQGPLELVETNDTNETEFEKAWKDLQTRLKLKSKFSRVDKLASLGTYGILLLGLSDVSTPEGFMKPAKKTAKLMYVKPFGEEHGKIELYETDTKNARYGMPTVYSVEIMDIDSNVSMTLKVHHTRIIHITLDILESEIAGAPVLESVYNRLADLEKLVGGDAEMFWRGARPGYSGNVDKEFQMTPEMEADLQDQIDEYEHNLRRMLINQGLDLQALAQQIADPKSHVDVQLTMISAVTGIPKRILSGSERGELASSQDVGEWKEYVQTRREEHAEWNIVRPFVDRMIELSILPIPADGKYSIKWPDIFALSEKERVEIGKSRAQALKEYSMSPVAEAIVPSQAFLKYCFGLSNADMELVGTMQEDEKDEELMLDVVEKMEKLKAPQKAAQTTKTEKSRPVIKNK